MIDTPLPPTHHRSNKKALWRVEEAIIEGQAESRRNNTVQMNTAVSPETLTLRNELADRLDWTHRRVLETALNVLADIINEPGPGTRGAASDAPAV